MVTVGGEGEALTQLLSALPLAYMAACCYYSLFQLGMFSFYHVVPHATNAHSLLMNAAQVSCCLHERHGRPCTETCSGHTVSLLPSSGCYFLFQLGMFYSCHAEPHATNSHSLLRRSRPGGLPLAGLTLY